jgi:regulation of enolase protein 1 (concanavalin A-like superfamily)
MLVSVVTRGLSDDANAFVVDGDEVLLRVSRLGSVYAFHASTDGGGFWQLVRYFDLDTAGAVEVGFEAQSPTGPGCTVTFDLISFLPTRLADPRDGS